MRILIVEDDPLIALDLQIIVEGEGHEVMGPVATLTEAHAYLNESFDFAFLDIDVVGGQTFEVASRLNERSIPFAFVSASRRSDVPEQLGGVFFIAKPFTESAVVRTLAARH
jgi:CheY-like chemotaxis protein